MDKIQGFGKNFAANFTPFAARSQQYLKEQLGQADDKTQLPPDYLELEKRVDALKQAHQKMLAVTAQFSNEAYDYPPNLKESVFDLSRTIAEKVQNLSMANSAAEAQQALTKAGPKPAPKTFNHAIGRAAISSAHLLDHSDPLATALEKYALASEQVGEARLQQDALIQSRFNAPFTVTLNTNLNVFAAKARKNVENARLTLDSAKSRAKNGPLGFSLPGAAQKKENVLPEDDQLTEEQRAEIERAEDEFVGSTEEAVGVMKNVLDTPEPLRNLADLVQAQLEFHKRAYEIYSELAPLIDGLQVEQEANYRKSREGGA
ncbi:BAR domain-containing family protein [Peziza echinospora]|nr:BAR domain-containing family protein [Peziza echinospora]